MKRIDLSVARCAGLEYGGEDKVSPWERFVAKKSISAFLFAVLRY